MAVADVIFGYVECDEIADCGGAGGLAQRLGLPLLGVMTATAFALAFRLLRPRPPTR